MPRVSRRELLAGGGACLATLAAMHARPVSAQAAGEVALNVNALPIPSFDPRDATNVRYGALQFRSGLVLTSSFRRFGGLSALHLDAKGESFIMLSDKGDWFTGRLIYDGSALKGLADVKSAPMMWRDGTTLAKRRWFDTESLTFDGSIAYVGIERVNKIVRFDFSKGGILAPAEVVAAPAEVDKLPFNLGLESLVFVGKGHALDGTLIAISEEGLDENGNLTAFLIGGPAPGIFKVRRTESFDISDATLLPSGHLLILERKFSFTKGMGIRIRRIPLAAIHPGALVDGPVIFNVDLGYEIDNMEGIASHVASNGDTVITMISDDNFSLIQRTLLLQFTLVDE
ncbi:MAG: esterase-like activity of phytase family protein [Xanthobacteraceae bacterium]|nr:esterase-like activity of phytase family protein [Xanthobacteraceae bacterium]